jgi:hypothetical protein
MKIKITLRYACLAALMTLIAFASGCSKPEEPSTSPSPGTTAPGPGGAPISGQGGRVKMTPVKPQG